MVDGQLGGRLLRRRRGGGAGHRRPGDGEVRESWTGYQVAWKMARGYSGAFGHKLNAPYVFLPLCAIFLSACSTGAGPWRVANLDLLVLLGFGVSHFFFNRARSASRCRSSTRSSLYLFGRALWIGVRGGGGGAAAGLAGDLAAGRRPLPGRLPGRPQRRRLGRDRRRLRQRRRRRPHHPRRTALRQLPRGRLAGRHLRPGQLLRLRPLRAVWPWSGAWDDLPAAHGAAVFFDLATFALLFLLGRRIRPGPAGRTLAADPRLRLGRLPLHRLRPRVELQRRPGRGAPGGDAPRRSPVPLPAAPARPGDLHQVRPSLLAPMLRRPLRATRLPRTTGARRVSRARASPWLVVASC